MRKGYLLAFAGVALVAVPPFLTSYWTGLATEMLIFAILAMSLDILLGYTGMPSFGHAGFFGVAAYAVAILSTRHHLNFWVCVAGGIAVGALLSAALGLLVSHVRDVYFLMITLALGMVLWGLSYRWIPMTGGDNGISGIPRLEAHAGLPLAGPVPFYYVTLAVFAACALAMALLVYSPFGLTLKGIRESESRMKSLGVNTWLHRYLSYVISGTFAGVAGVMWAYYNGFVSPSYLELTASSELFLMVTLGGSGTLAGPAIGAAVIVLLKNVISAYTQRWLLILGTIYILTILWAPQGLWNLGAAGKPRPWRRAHVMWILFALLGLLGAAGHMAGDTVVARAAPPQSDPGPIRVGFLAPLSGPYAQNGRDILNGMLLQLEQIGYQAAGRRIEVIVEDDEAIPAVSLTKARKLVERDRVHLMAGALLSSTGYALAPYIDASHIPMVYPVVSADDLTQRMRSKWIVRTGYTGSQPSHPFGEYAYHELKLRKVATIALDYAFGWESVSGFQRTFEAQGGEVTQKLWCPVSVHDFAPYLAQVSRDVDAVYALFLGRSALQFMRQFEEFGLKRRVLLIGAGPLTDEHVLPFMGDEALGVITALHYSAALDNPANRAFAAAYRQKYNKVPSYYAESMYTGAKWFVAAIEAVGGQVEDPEKFVEALQSVKLTDLPRGPMELDAYGNPIENVYIRKVERVNGQLQNTVIHTFPRVSQFWNFDPVEYLKQPLYSRRSVRRAP